MGVGAIGGLHLEAYRRHGTKITLGTVEMDSQKNKRLTQEVDHVYRVLEDAVAHSYDLFDICLPTFLHFEAIEKILSTTSSQILCEKPLVLNITELQKLKKQFPTLSDRVNCAFVERFNEPFYLAKQWSEKQRGPFSIILERRTKKPVYAEWSGDVSRGGDVMLDLGIHDIDAACWWTNSVIDKIEKHTVSGDTESVSIIMADGSTVKIITGWDLPQEASTGIVNTFRIVASNNSSFSYNADDEKVSYDGGEHHVIPRFPSAYYSEIDTFLGIPMKHSGGFPTLNEIENTMITLSKIQEDRK